MKPPVVMPNKSDASGVLFNPLQPEFRNDPYPYYERLRRLHPVHRSPGGFWVLSRYEDVLAAQKDRRLRFISPQVASIVEKATRLSASRLGSFTLALQLWNEMT